MSKHRESFALPVPLDAAAEATRAALEADGWDVLNAGETTFLARQRIDILARLYRHPSKVAILLRKVSDGETRVDLYGSIFGLGPLQKSRVRRALSELKNALRTTAERGS